MDTLQSIALASGMAWGSGLRLYAVILAAGLMGRVGYLDLPAGLQILQHPWVLSAAGFMVAIEFLADKIPLVDSLWDAIHSFIRIPAGAVLAAAALAPLSANDPVITLVAALLGGTLTAGTHFAKAGSRALINTSPEPVSNISVSLAEDAALAGGLYLAFIKPLVFLALLAIFVVIVGVLLRRLWHAKTRFFGRRQSAQIS